MCSGSTGIIGIIGPITDSTTARGAGIATVQCPGAVAGIVGGAVPGQWARADTAFGFAASDDNLLSIGAQV